MLYKDQIPSFVDQSWNFLKQCDFFKVSDEEALLITGKSTLQEASQVFLEKTKAVFAITLGKEGTLLGINQSTTTIESIPVKPVDTTGAGDAFVGAVLNQLNQHPTETIRQLPEVVWKQILRNANKAGARTCEYMGALEAFKHLSNEIFK